MAKMMPSADRLRWLLAETVVVVVGILIAIAVDGYRSDLTDRRLERDYVDRVRADLHQDLEYLDSVWNPRLKMKRDALDSIAPIIRGQLPLPEDKLGFLREVSLGGVLGASVDDWYTDTTFQDMLATGNMRLIKDPDIRALISQYYRGTENATRRVEARFTDYFMVVHSVMPAELRDDLNFEALEEFGVDFAIQRVVSDEFRVLLNQEYNLMLFMEAMAYEQFAKATLDRLNAYRSTL
jgi:hypothetical protein